MNIHDIHILRDKLLDWVGSTVNDTAPDSIAKMIKLEAKQSAVEPIQSGLISRLIIFKIIIFEKDKFMIFSQDKKLVDDLEKSIELINLIVKNNEFEINGYKIAIHSFSNFINDRKIYECGAVM